MNTTRKKIESTDGTRNQEIILLASGGEYTLKEIGARYGLSKQRIHQIIKRNLKLQRHYIAVETAERTP